MRENTSSTRLLCFAFRFFFFPSGSALVMRLTNIYVGDTHNDTLPREKCKAILIPSIFRISSN